MKCPLINMVHHNPCEPPLVAPTNDGAYLAQLGFDGDVVMDALAGCILAAYDPLLIPPDSQEYRQTIKHRKRIAAKITQIADAGLTPYLYTDIPTIPVRALDLYPGELTHQDDPKRLCIRCPKLWDITDALIEEAFALYPQAEGIFVRFGENYAKFNVLHMMGNDIITKPCSECAKLSQTQRYITAISHLNHLVCKGLGKKLFIRTWGFGDDSMHMSAEIYRKVTESLRPHRNLFFSMKITRGDFWRYELCNPSLGLGGHNQMVEIQLAREYEGKGAFPNWLAGNWMTEPPEIKLARHSGLLKDKQRLSSSGPKPFEFQQGPAQGVFAWTCGGGWGGPFLKFHDWVEVNTFALGKLSADPRNFKPEQTIALWCRQRYGWPLNSDETAIFTILLNDSEPAVVKMLYSFDYATRPEAAWTMANEVWFRDDHLINNLEGLDTMLIWAIKNGVQRRLLDEKEQAIHIWENIVNNLGKIRNEFPAQNHGEALFASVQAAKVLAQAIWALWKARLGWHECGKPQKPLPEELRKIWSSFRNYWLEYRAFEGKGVATLINTGWKYGQLADAFEDPKDHFPSSAPPIYIGHNGDYLIR